MTVSVTRADVAEGEALKIRRELVVGKSRAVASAHIEACLVSVGICPIDGYEKNPCKEPEWRKDFEAGDRGR